jgi:hypothetical protein
MWPGVLARVRFKGFAALQTLIQKPLRTFWEHALRGEGIADEFIRIVDDYVAKRFAGAGKAAE